MAKSNLILDKDWRDMFCALPDDKAGKLIKAAFMCHEGEHVEIEDPVLSAVFAMIANKIKENADKYERKCEQNAKNRASAVDKKEKAQRTSTNVNERQPSGRNKNKNIKEKVKVKDINNMSGKPDGTQLMPVVREVIGYLNDKAGTHFLFSTRQTADKIKARLNDGFTVDDMKKVIDVKTAEWMGTEWQKFIRPETLFGSKFESYLNQPTAQRKNKAGRFGDFPQRSDDAENQANIQKLLAMQ